MEEIKVRFAVIEDTRHPGYVEHKLADVLIMIMCSVLSGIDNLDEITHYLEESKDFFKEKLGIEKVPSKPTLSRILSMVD
ncbi:MAG: transposase family protein, partial [Spirochaetales bacterium]